MPESPDMEEIMSSVFERRTEPRYPVHLPLRVRLTIDGEEQLLEDSVLQNVSNFGLLLLLQNDLPLGSKVVIEFNPDSARSERELRGQVVRKERRGVPEKKVGVAVTGL